MTKPAWEQECYNQDFLSNGLSKAKVYVKSRLFFPSRSYT